jgi:hypothetical protein
MKSDRNELQPLDHNLVPPLLRAAFCQRRERERERERRSDRETERERERERESERAVLDFGKRPPSSVRLAVGEYAVDMCTCDVKAVGTSTYDARAVGKCSVKHNAEGLTLIIWQ